MIEVREGLNDLLARRSKPFEGLDHLIPLGLEEEWHRNAIPRAPVDHTVISRLVLMARKCVDDISDVHYECAGERVGRDPASVFRFDYAAQHEPLNPLEPAMKVTEVPTLQCARSIVREKEGQTSDYSL